MGWQKGHRQLQLSACEGACARLVNQAWQHALHKGYICLYHPPPPSPDHHTA